MIQVYQFFNKPVPNSSILVPMAREMLPCQFVSIIVHQMLKKCHRKLCWRSWHSCKKGGRGKKYFIFAMFYLRNPFLRKA